MKLESRWGNEIKRLFLARWNIRTAFITVKLETFDYIYLHINKNCNIFHSYDIIILFLAYFPLSTNTFGEYTKRNPILSLCNISVVFVSVLSRVTLSSFISHSLKCICQDSSWALIQKQFQEAKELKNTNRLLGCNN